MSIWRICVCITWKFIKHGRSNSVILLQSMAAEGNYFSVCSVIHEMLHFPCREQYKVSSCLDRNGFIMRLIYNCLCANCWPYFRHDLLKHVNCKTYLNHRYLTELCCSGTLFLACVRAPCFFHNSHLQMSDDMWGVFLDKNLFSISFSTAKVENNISQTAV